MELKRREGTIKYIIPNLRNRWKDELAAYSDNQVAAAYEDFSLSEDAGNNDEKFPEWFDSISSYQV